MIAIAKTPSLNATTPVDIAPDGGVGVVRRRLGHAGMSPSARTSSRSATSSSVVILMRALAKSSCSMPSTTLHARAVAAHRVAELQALGRAVLAGAGRPRGSASRRLAVFCQTLLTDSIAACAALAAELEPRASMTAAPRFWTVSMNSCSSQSGSPITSGAGLPPILACAKSGNCVAEWLPQIATLRHVLHQHAGALGELRLGPVLVEAGHREPAVGGNVGRVAAGDEAVGVARVADDEHADVARRVVVDGLTLRAEDAAVDLEQVAALHARLAGDRADEQRPAGAVERLLQGARGDDALEQRVRLVLELHDQAVERLHRRLDLEQAQHDRLVGAEQLARGDPVDERVADLAGRARDGDVER